MRPHAIWITGLPGAGKSTLAVAVAAELLLRGAQVTITDGDLLRSEHGGDLGFSAVDRAQQARRAAARARAALDAGRWAVVALVSPFSADRAAARAVLAAGGHPMLEVHLATSVAVCAGRDPKGLWARAARGELRGLSGADDPYEAPLSPEVRLGGGEPLAEAVRVVLAAV